MQRKVITDLSALEEFDRTMVGYTGVKFPIPYWQHCRVVACYNSDEQMIGGYALALEPPFRSLLVLSKIPVAHGKFLESVSPSQMIEASALWADAIMPLRDRAKLFQLMLQDICQQEKPYFLYVYNLNRPYLQKLYGKLHPKVLFRGSLPLALPNSHPVGIECVSLAEIKQEIKSQQYHFLRC